MKHLCSMHLSPEAHSYSSRAIVAGIILCNSVVTNANFLLQAIKEARRVLLFAHFYGGNNS